MLIPCSLMKVYLCPLQKLYTIVLCSVLLAATYGYYGVLCGHCSFALVSNPSSPLHMIVEQRWVTLCITSTLAGPDSSAAHLCALVYSHNNRLTCTPPPGYSMASTGYSLKGLNHNMAYSTQGFIFIFFFCRWGGGTLCQLN